MRISILRKMTSLSYFYKIQVIIGCYYLCVNAIKDDSCHCGSKLNRQTLFTSRKEGYCTTDNSQFNTVEAHKGNMKKMVRINAGAYFIGTNDPVFVADGEGPKREVILDSFYIDKFEVSNEEFTAFVSTTGYTTEAENFGDSFVFEGLLAQNIKSKIDKVVAQAPWWLPVKKASWLHPEGPGTNITCKNKKEKE